MIQFMPIIIIPPNELTNQQFLDVYYNGQPSIFLAGGITKCRNWQQDAITYFSDTNLTIFNPRRDDFDVTNKDMEREQITWEYNKLRFVSLIVFWFSNETVQPITLFELGSALERQKSGKQKVYVGVDPQYVRKNDVIIQSYLEKQKEIYDDLHKMCNYIKTQLM